MILLNDEEAGFIARQVSFWLDRRRKGAGEALENCRSILAKSMDAAKSESEKSKYIELYKSASDSILCDWERDECMANKCLALLNADKRSGER